MRGFIRSCKVAAADVIASRTYTAHGTATPADVFALHLYTRTELFRTISRALQERRPKELAEWRPVVWYIAAAQRCVSRPRSIDCT